MASRISQRDMYSVDKAQDIANRYESRSASGSWASRNSLTLGAIAFTALALGAFYYLSTPELKNAFFNQFVLIALGLGLLYGAVKSKFKLQGAILGGVIFVVIAGAVIFFLPTILNTTATYVPQAKDLASKAQLVLNPEKFVGSSLGGIFQTPTTEAPAERTITAEFVNPRNSAPFEVSANVGVKTREDITLGFSCFVDGKKVVASPSTINVASGSSQQFFQVSCTNSQGGKELSLKVSAPFVAEAVLPVSIAASSGSSLGRSYSTMPYDGPYALSLEVQDSQPLLNRSTPYPLNVKLFRKESGASLLSIESLEVSPQGTYYSLQCKDALEGLSLSADRSRLDSLVIDKAKDNYAFSCGLDVTSAPVEGYEQSFINAKASYTLEKEFKTPLSGAVNVA